MCVVNQWFAATRCWWSEGDSNRRSSLWFVALTEDPRSFSEVSGLKPIGELF
jgi:hypothetical protein